MRKRDLARDRARREAEAPMKQRAIYDMLKAHLPERDFAIIGWKNLLAHLNEMGIKRPNGVDDPSYGMVMRWKREFGFPLLSGSWRPKPMSNAPCVTTAYALIAWLLAQVSSGDRMLFSVSYNYHQEVANLGVRPLFRDVGRSTDSIKRPFAL